MVFRKLQVEEAIAPTKYGSCAFFELSLFFVQIYPPFVIMICRQLRFGIPYNVAEFKIFVLLSLARRPFSLLPLLYIAVIQNISNNRTIALAHHSSSVLLLCTLQSPFFDSLSRCICIYSHGGYISETSQYPLFHTHSEHC